MTTSSPDPTAGAEVVDVWLARPVHDLTPLLDLLHPAESRWAARLCSEDDRALFVTGRVLAREALARHGDGAVASRGPTGRPDPVRARARGVGVCVSHTSGAVAVGVSRSGALGVDVETHDSAARIARLLRAPVGPRPATWVHRWARCEALAKALDAPMATLVRDRLAAARTGTHPHPPAPRHRLVLRSCDTDLGAVLAVAHESSSRITVRDGDELLSAAYHRTIDDLTRSAS